MEPKEDLLYISNKKISANGNVDKSDNDGLSPAAPVLATQLLMELKKNTLNFLNQLVKIKMILK